jgi:hypothetical protein
MLVEDALAARVREPLQDLEHPLAGISSSSLRHLAISVLRNRASRTVWVVVRIREITLPAVPGEARSGRPDAFCAWEGIRLDDPGFRRIFHVKTRDARRGRDIPRAVAVKRPPR